MSGPQVTDPARVTAVRATHLAAHASGGWSTTGLMILLGGQWRRVAVHDRRLWVHVDGVIVQVDDATVELLLAAEAERLLTDAGVTP